MSITQLLGPHYLPGSYDEFETWARLARPPHWMMLSEVDADWFKWNGQMLSAVRQGTRLFVKRIETPPNVETDPEGTAREYAASFWPLIEYTDRLGFSRNRVVWGGINEVGMNTGQVDLMEKYARFEVELLKQGKQMGVHFGVGTWAVGNPTDNNMLTEYWAPVLHELVSTQMGLYNLHGYGPLTNDFVFRYREHHAIFEKMGFHNVPILMTEFGNDQMRDQNGAVIPGTGQWKAIYPNLTAYYNNYILPALRGFHQDAGYFCGAMLFCLNDGGAWKSFDVSYSDPGICNLLAQTNE